MTMSRLLQNALKLAESSLKANLEKINRINVFPVADNDTGSNLFRTVKGAADGLNTGDSYSNLLESYTQSVFLKASGNSGMMFSMFLSHFTECLSCDMAIDLNLSRLAQALLTASQQSKKKIDDFVSGTLISYLESVALGMTKLTTLSLSENDFGALSDLLSTRLDKTSVDNPYLKDTSLVDAGAMGVHYWLTGFIAGLCHVEKDRVIPDVEDDVSVSDHCESVHWETKPNYSYCVQITLTISEDKQSQLSSDLAAHGDCNLNLYRHGQSRVHVHTNDSKALFKKIMTYADVTEVKIENMMMQYQANQSKGGIAIVTDSSADIPQAILDEHAIHCIPLTITHGQQVMLDGLTIDETDLASRMQSHSEYPKTASPSLGMIKESFAWLSKTHEHVIVVAISSKMSATYQAFKNLASEFSNISVIDSRTTSGAHGWIVSSVADMAKKGLSVETILTKAQQLIKDTDVFILLNDCDAMTKSGRFGRAKAWVAQTMKFKPIVGINQDGAGVLLGNAMSLPKQLDKLFKMIREKHEQNPIRRFSILHSDNHANAVELESVLEQKLALKSSGILPVSAVIQLHAGQGALAVAIEQEHEHDFAE
ncbi:MAG: DegV family protein [Legionellaceae bacterium]|nr:DegV family protein [Legionellaceae bacterium]